MRYAIITDIHANLQACEALLADIAAQSVDRVICLGDAVGYGPQPAEVLTLLHAHVTEMLIGNHDAAAAGMADTDGYSRGALASLKHTRSKLNGDALRYLRSRPWIYEGKDFACAHGDFSAPEQFLYVETAEDSVASFEARPEPLLFVGHTHKPAVYVVEPDGTCASMPATDFDLQPGCRYLVNPGSVGMPRTRELRATYCIYDTAPNRVSFHHTGYSVQTFRKLVEQDAADSEQLAYVLGLLDSHALPTLNPTVNFAAASAARSETQKTDAPKPAGKKTIVLAGARKSPVSSSRTASRPQKESGGNGTLIGAVVALCVIGGTVGLIMHSRQRTQARSLPPAVEAPDFEPAPPPAVQPPKERPDPEPERRPAPQPQPVARQPIVEPPTPRVQPPPAMTERIGTASERHAVLGTQENQTLNWNDPASWHPAGVPDGKGISAVIGIGRQGVRTLEVQLGQDVTLGKVAVIEQSNASVIWNSGHTLIFDNGAANAEWFRNKGSVTMGALRQMVCTDLRLNSTLEANWTVQRGIELKNQISGRGGLIINHHSNDGADNNRQVWFRGGPNSYEGGTTLNGRVSASRMSIFTAEKNGAFGSGDVTLNELARLVLTDRDGPDNMIADSAALRLTEAGSSHSIVVLSKGVDETVGSLYFNGKPQLSGTWGSGASSAQHKSDDFFSGPGVLTVRAAR